MVVADFFGGSVVTAAVANRLGRKFIHTDMNINSTQTTCVRLLAAKAGFGIVEIKDGVSLYRNTVQTMERLKKSNIVSKRQNIGMLVFVVNISLRGLKFAIFV